MGAAAAVAERLDVHAALGGRHRSRAVGILAAVLGLQAADTAAVGALAAPLERSLHVGNASIGLLVAATTLVGAAATLPFGVLTDRVRRVRMLRLSVWLWAAATAASALAPGFTVLLATRVALGVLVAVAGPAVASLVGDLFPAGERGRMYGWILTGELLGAGVGILLAGGLAGPFGWRVALAVLAAPAAAVAVWLRRLDEPARGGQAPLEPEGTASQAAGGPDVAAAAREAGVRPSAGVVRPPEDLSLVEAARHVLRIRTNDALIVASGLGYFLFGGLETFAELYLRERFGVGQSLASVLFVVVAGGALAGVLLAGWVADRRTARGHLSARLGVAAVAYVATVAAFVPGMVLGSLALALPVLVVAAAALGATNPPVDAARLDVVPGWLWGRAEAVRTAFRQLLQGLAPVVFGLVSAGFGGRGGGLGAGVGAARGAASASDGHALAATFAVLCLPLLVAAGVLWAARRRYLRDAVAASRSEAARER